MRVITNKRLKDYWQREPAVKGALQAWYAEAKAGEWKTPADIKAKFGAASILQSGRVVFNLCGNRYRLVVRINYRFAMVYIRFIGTHAEYDQIDAETI
jgi:mRNA interferase HigB